MIKDVIIHDRTAPQTDIGETMTADIILYEGPRELATVTARRPVLFLAEPKAAERFWEFFTANIRNRNTRRAY